MLKILERDDFDDEGAKGFRRLTPNQPVGLKYGEIVVAVKNVVKANGKIKHIEVTAQKADSTNKVKNK